MNERRADGREQDAKLNTVEEDESHRLSLLYLTLLALALGIVTGFGAVRIPRPDRPDPQRLLRRAFSWSHYDANVFTAAGALGRAGSSWCR